MSIENLEIADAHVHIGALGNAIPYFGAKPPTFAETPWDMEADAKSRIRAMDAIGCDWAVIQPNHDYLRPEGIKDTMRVNDRMGEYRKIAPDRFRIACGTVEPLHGQHSLRELERVKHELNLDGVSWHHRFSGCSIDSKWMWPLLEKIQALSLTPVVHVNAESNLEATWQLQRIAKNFPDMDFLALDGFYGYERANQILGTAQNYPNIVWDIGGAVTAYVSVELWTSLHGSRNICFSGAASYPLPPGATVKKPALLDDIENLPLTVEDKANILSGNIRRIFRLDSN